MTTRWETTVALAREVVEDCDKGMLDGARIARLARSVLDLQAAMLGTARRAAGRPPPNDASAPTAPAPEEPPAANGDDAAQGPPPRP